MKELGSQTPAITFLKQVRTHLHIFRSKGEQMWISVKTVNNDHLRKNSDPKHLLLCFLSSYEHTCKCSGQNVKQFGFPLKPLITTIYEGIPTPNTWHSVSSAGKNTHANLRSKGWKLWIPVKKRYKWPFTDEFPLRTYS